MRPEKGNSWTLTRLKAFRSTDGIPAHCDGEMRQQNEMTLAEAAERLSAHESTVRRLIRSGAIPRAAGLQGHATGD